MSYVIQRKTNEFVARSGSQSSYTTDLRFAEKFSSEESARRNACGDERVVNLEHLLEQFRR